MPILLCQVFQFNSVSFLGGVSYVSSEQAVHGECATLPLIVCIQNDQDIFDCHDDRERPNDNGERSEEVIEGRGLGECGGVDIERAGTNVTVNDTSRLICKTIRVSP